jgi:hypothetical protein
MVQINEAKTENAAVILADGFEIGNERAGGLSYKELGGLLGNLLTGIRSHRNQWLAENENNASLPIPPCDPATMKELVAKVTDNNREKISIKECSGEDDEQKASDDNEEEKLSYDYVGE